MGTRAYMQVSDSRASERFDRVNLRPLIKRLRELNQFEFTQFEFLVSVSDHSFTTLGHLRMRIERYDSLVSLSLYNLRVFSQSDTV